MSGAPPENKLSGTHEMDVLPGVRAFEETNIESNPRRGRPHRSADVRHAAVSFSRVSWVPDRKWFLRGIIIIAKASDDRAPHKKSSRARKQGKAR